MGMKMPVTMAAVALLVFVGAVGALDDNNIDWAVPGVKRWTANMQTVVLVKVTNVDKSAKNGGYPIMTTEILATLKGAEQKKGDTFKFYDYNVAGWGVQMEQNPLAYKGDITVGQTLLVLLQQQVDKNNPIWLNNQRQNLIDGRYLFDMMPVFADRDAFFWIDLTNDLQPGALDQMRNVLISGSRPVEVDRTVVDALLVELDSPDFNVREKAVQQLQQQGTAVIPDLLRTMQTGTPEASDRAQQILSSYFRLTEFFNKVLNWNPAPFWIDMLDESQHVQYALESLKKASGKDFGVNREAWVKWYNENKTAGQIDPKSPLGTLSEYYKQYMGEK